MTSGPHRCRDRVDHRWDLSPKEAIALQKELAGKVRLEPFDAGDIRYVVGVDVSFPGGRVSARKVPGPGIAAAVVYDMGRGEVIEKAVVKGEVRMAYIPGLLSFRECPLAIKALEKLRTRIDIVMVDGQGVAHPRRFGIASHLGVGLGMRTFGCAKSILVGEVRGELGLEAGSRAELVDKGEVVGAAYRTRDGVNPVYISAGHLCDLTSVIRLMKRLCGKYRIPEPVRQAHILATQMRGRAV